MSLKLKLYTKPGCHLCEQAQADLERLRRRHPHTLELIDISANTELRLRYGERIPVLAVGGREYAAPLTAAALETTLTQAAQAAVMDETSTEARADPRAGASTEL